MDYKYFLHPAPTMSYSNTMSKEQYSPTASDESVSQGKDGDKTIPFLRRLVDMLQENEGIISFYPGSHKKGQSTPARIVVHDRNRVETEILPRYFNHSSFASLRRQLNYFAFCRVGKGKQKGATYCNEKVFQLNDILRLKRRAIGSTIPVVEVKKFEAQPREKMSPVGDGKKKASFSHSSGNAVSLDSATNTQVKIHESAKNSKKRKRPNKKTRKIIDSIVPVVHLPQKKKAKKVSSLYKNAGTEREIEGLSISFSFPPASDNARDKVNMGARVISLDLTTPPSVTQYDQAAEESSKSCHVHTVQHNTKEADVLAGCSALLSLGFSSF